MNCPFWNCRINCAKACPPHSRCQWKWGLRLSGFPAAQSLTCWIAQEAKELMGFMQIWRNGGQAGTGGKLTACCKKRRWEAKPHRSEGDRDPQQHQLCFEAGGHSHNEMQPASQTLHFTEAESVTLMNSSISLSSLSFPGHQNCWIVRHVNLQSSVKNKGRERN